MKSTISSREYSIFETGQYTRASALAFLLKDILLRPRVALYVTHLSIGHDEIQWQNSDDGDDDDDRYSMEWLEDGHILYPNDDMALFIKAIQRASFVPRNEVEYWITDVKKGNEDSMLALLPLLLPNLTKISLVGQSDYAKQTSEPARIFQRIAAAENRIFLTRLTTVDLHIEDPREDSFVPWKWLRILTTLPTVQSVHVKRMHHMDYAAYCDLDNERQTLVSRTSNITELTFIESGLGPKSVFRLLESIKGLKRFSYEQSDERVELFDPFWMRAALLANAQQSLEFLRIISSKTRPANLLGTFRGFTALRELETDMHLLTYRAPLDRLAELLPASVEKVYLHTGLGLCCDGIVSLVEAFENAKSQRLPNLRALRLGSKSEIGTRQKDKDLMKTLKGTCQDIGIELMMGEG